MNANNREGKTVIDIRGEHEDIGKNDLQREEAPEKWSERLEENRKQNMPVELGTPTSSQSRECHTMLDGSVRKSSLLQAIFQAWRPRTVKNNLGRVHHQPSVPVTM